MRITQCEGFVLEKTSKSSPEDSFHRAVVTFVNDENHEKKFHLLYLCYFENLLPELTGWDRDPLFTVGNRDVCFKDIAGIVSFIKNPGFKERKRVYIHSEREFSALFQNVDFDKIKALFETLERVGSYELSAPSLFLKQSK